MPEDHDTLIALKAGIEHIRGQIDKIAICVPEKCAEHTEQIKTLFVNQKWLLGFVGSLVVGMLVMLVKAVAN